MNNVINTEPAADYRACLRQCCDALTAQRPPLAVYANNYRHGHIRALAMTYPVTRKLLGGDVFASLAWAYTVHHPPAHWDINRYGDRFAALLSAQQHGARARHYNWRQLADIAAVEYLITELYYARQARFNRESPCVLPIAAGPECGRELAPLLAEHHPYVDCDRAIVCGQSIAVWREQLCIHLLAVAAAPLC